ncbi:MAG: single-stranded-DNA-specific exonuclease RecJ [Dehalococcoidia bacterium]
MSRPAKQWQLAETSQSHTLPPDLSPMAARVLLARGISSAEQLQFFLEPPHRLPHDPLRLHGMDRALQRLYRAIQQGEKVGIFGDFDVDGVTGAAIITEGIASFGVPVIPYLPHRVEEGHGLSADAVQHLADAGASLIVTVDCGITSVEEVAQARSRGVDVIITDHHTPPALLPDAEAIINPKMADNQYPFEHLSGAGLGFKLIQGLFQYHGQPWSRGLLELAALGTIADLVPLVDENRYLVQQGLAELAKTQRVGLRALYQRAGIDPSVLNAETVSFQIAPRLNSPGRMSHAENSLQLLTTTSPEEADALAEQLEALNQDRRDLTEQAYAVAYDQVQQQEYMPSLLLVSNQHLTPGISGLVAGRLAEAFHRPSVVLAATDEEQLVASGRSIPEFDLIKAFTTCQDLFVRYGGHSQAAGFTIRRDRLPLLEERLLAVAAELLGEGDLQPLLAIDAEVKIADLTEDFIRWLNSLEPFGKANPQPVFLTRRLQVKDLRYLGKAGQHLRLRLRQGDQEITALAFNQADHWVDVPYLDLVYTVTIDRWRGTETVNLKVLDFKPSEV